VERTSRRTQAERRAETERRVLDAAIGLIAEHGVRAVTMAAVGAAAGYSRGIANHQFGTRQGLIRAVAEEVQLRFAPNPEGLRGRARVLSLVDGYLGSLETRSVDARVFLRLWAAAIGGEEPELAAVFAERDAYFRDYVAGAIAEGVEDGELRPGVDAGAVAVAVVGQLRGIGLQWQLSASSIDLDAVRAEVSRWVAAALEPPPRTL
jgi:AcrR family transcriptional regulator